MIPYKRTSAPEHVRQLLEDIEKHHEEFCCQDDPDRKSEALRLLKGYAAEYLNQVIHVHKFKTPAVERVLAQSVLGSVDFDPREASEAFEHLAKYGQNLLEQPWREEFRLLNLSSGYYVHNIQAYLENPHEILIEMGYANINDDVLQLAGAPLAPRLKQISRDCFLASQECLILSKISDYVQTQTKNHGITAAEIYGYRCKLTGDVPTIGKKICYDLHQKQFEAQQLRLKSSGIQLPNFLANQENCPVDNLIDINSSVGLRHRDLPEREVVRNILQNTQREQDHIYDPVPAEDFVAKMNHKLLSPNSPSINSSSSNFMYPREPSGLPYSSHVMNGYSQNAVYSNPNDFELANNVTTFDRHGRDNRSATASPYIPRTVAAFDSSSRSGLDYRKPSHSSSSSVSSRGQYPHQALEKRKVPQDELMRNSGGLNDPDWLRMELEKHSMSRNAPEQSRQPMNTLHENYPKPRGSENTRGAECDDILKEAYRYNQGTSTLMNNRDRKTEPRTYGRSHLDFETSSSKVSSDSRVSSDRDLENKSSGSSETSSWGYSKLPNPSNQPWYGAQSQGIARQEDYCSEAQLTLKHVDTCIDDYQTEYRKEYTSKPKLPPTETNLDSCETINAKGSRSVPVNATTDLNLLASNERDKYPISSVDKLSDFSRPAGPSREIIFQVDSEHKSSAEECSTDTGRKCDDVRSKNKDAEAMDTSMDPWDCPHCTYRNHTEENVCGVCCKSRDFKFELEPTSNGRVLKLETASLPKSVKSNNTVATTRPSTSQKRDGDGEASPNENLKTSSNTANVVTQDTIACPVCTYLNPITLVTCEMCQSRIKNRGDS